MKIPSATSLVDEAGRRLAAGDDEAAATSARLALDLDARSPAAWRLLGMACEAGGRVEEALSAYESALALAPGDPDVLNGLARLALEMDLPAVASGMARQAISLRPGDTEAACLFARALAREGRHPEAIHALQSHLSEHPGDAVAWSTLGVLVSETGDFETAETFLGEAVRLAPDLTAARFNLANLLVTRGEAQKALEVLERMPESGLTPRERATLRYARGCARLQSGDLRQGWRDYAARNDPAFPGAADFDIPGRRWRPGEPLAGLRLLVVGEQGLGDEVLFGSLVPDLLERPDRPEALALAVEPRLAGLFRRSFPGIQVIDHATVMTGGRRVRRLAGETGGAPFTAWTPMADLLQDLRPAVSDFGDRPAFLRADPGRIGAWRSWLGGLPGRVRVGLLWKSGLMSGARRTSFAAFADWGPVLATPGVTFVNLQYGDTAAEVAFARDRLGVKVHEPPGLDLRQDLEEVAALSCALDLVIAVSNASFNIAAACGARSWLVTAPDAWTRLGSRDYPWYPHVRVFPVLAPGDWGQAFTGMAGALAREAAA